MPQLPPSSRLLAPQLALLLLTTGVVAAQEADDGRSLHWREIAVAAHLDADGRLHVRERQAMVFDGAWNGGEREFDLRVGQQLRLDELTRIDAGAGTRTALVRCDLANVDEFDWRDRETLRWRSRMASDPPFRNREIVYELAYTLWPVLERRGDGDYLLRHDFAFPDRAGVIERFTVDLTIDDAWAGPGGARIREAADRLPPGRGYTVRVPLRHVGPGEPAAVPEGPPGWVRGLTTAGAVLVPLLVFLGLRRRAREMDRLAPLTPPSAIDAAWLRSHIFAYPAEVVGTAWDRSVGEAEVAALLARLVEDGRLTSRVDDEGGDPVLHLRRVAPLSSFQPHERDLLEGLFFDGGESTDTRSIREHYEQKGFDPASRIRKALTARLDELPGPGRVRRPWALPAVVIIVGIVVAVAGPGPTGSTPIAVIGLLIAGVMGLFTLGFAGMLAPRVTHRTGLELGVLISLLLPALPLALLAAGVFERQRGLALYRPGAAMLVGLLIVLSGVAMMAMALSRSTEVPERLIFRRRLVSAREFFASELRRPEPRLRDAWFPYLLAFGLGAHIDRWFRAFGGRASSSAAVTAAAAASQSAGSAGGGWSGGGPQFGGGSWGGGGAGGTWGVAAAGMAAGVSAPSSSGGGGGGGSSSGGGGGGGW